MGNKVYSRTRGTSILALCYIEEKINEPGQKMYTYYYFSKKEKRYLSRTLIMHEGQLVNHLMYNTPEKLQELLDNGSLYGYVVRTVRRYEKAVELQFNELCSADKEMQLALKLGNTDRYVALERNNKLRAEEMLRPLLYSA